MLGWIPWLLNLLPSVLRIWEKKLDTDLEKYKVDGVVNVEAIKADTQIIQAQAQLQTALKDDPVLKWGRRLIIYPTGVWYTLIVWDCIARNLAPSLTWRILDLPPHLQYIPYAVTGFLLLHSISWMKK